jgi:hypothetical protein
MSAFKFHRLSAGDYGVSCGATFLGRVVRYGNEWDCWKGHEGLLHTQHHKTRRAAAESLLLPQQEPAYAPPSTPRLPT